ncbi:hypothetical protein [Streptomyces sp. SP2-10]|uniref:hypothetical protein n=1 Tax=Streptomyces sp. SP2-10 TaxID=2873385 RepID=UPI00223B56B2|nr:hypothetical protein [Streptomyces sp. SP2-10]
MLRDRRERQLHLVRSVAEAAQSVLLQPLPGRAGPLRIAGLYIPAEEEAIWAGTCTRPRGPTTTAPGSSSATSAATA